ncbi:hypothetical protein ACLMJK_002586 [Lecanora helva]
MSSTLPDPLSPALEPPPGVTPDFYDPFTLEPYNIVTVALCAALTSVLVIARVYTKVRIVKSMLWEDYTCIIAWIGFLGTLVIELKVGRNGGGTHHTIDWTQWLADTILLVRWNLHYEDLVISRQWTSYGDSVYSVSILFTKISILLLVKRIFLQCEYDIFYWIVQGLIIANAIFYTCFLFIPIWVCTPRAKIWHPTLPGHCLNLTVLLMSSAAWNIVSDLAMLSVPLWMIWKLQLSKRRKIASSVVFAAAGLACIASIIRIPYLILLIHTEDYTYHKIKGVMWSAAEQALGLTCACLPVLPRLFQYFTANTVSKSSDMFVQADSGKSAPAMGRLDERKRDWVLLREISKPSPPKPVYASSPDDITTYREDVEMGRKE